MARVRSMPPRTRASRRRTPPSETSGDRLLAVLGLFTTRDPGMDGRAGRPPVGHLRADCLPLFQEPRARWAHRRRVACQLRTRASDPGARSADAVVRSASHRRAARHERSDSSRVGRRDDPAMPRLQGAGHLHSSGRRPRPTGAHQLRARSTDAVVSRCHLQNHPRASRAGVGLARRSTRAIVARPPPPVWATQPRRLPGCSPLCVAPVQR